MSSITLRNAVETSEFVETLVRSLVKTGSTPRQIMVGIHNAFYHGELLTGAEQCFTDEQLGRIFEHIIALQTVLKEIED